MGKKGIIIYNRLPLWRFLF